MVSAGELPQRSQHLLALAVALYLHLKAEPREHFVQALWGHTHTRYKLNTSIKPRGQQFAQMTFMLTFVLHGPFPVLVIFGFSEVEVVNYQADPPLCWSHGISSQNLRRCMCVSQDGIQHLYFYTIVTFLATCSGLNSSSACLLRHTRLNNKPSNTPQCLCLTAGKSVVQSRTCFLGAALFPQPLSSLWERRKPGKNITFE